MFINENCGISLRNNFSIKFFFQLSCISYSGYPIAKFFWKFFLQNFSDKDVWWWFFHFECKDPPLKDENTAGVSVRSRWICRNESGIWKHSMLYEKKLLPHWKVPFIQFSSWITLSYAKISKYADLKQSPAKNDNFLTCHNAKGKCKISITIFVV